MKPVSLRDKQLAMANYLRNPGAAPAPKEVEPRRLKVYEDLVYNNIEGFISSGFPVLRSLYDDSQWHELIRLFVKDHRCRSPYFLEISQEFLQFLLDEHELRDCDPPFMTELAHYEWVELVLDVSEHTLPEATIVDDVLNTVLTLSPLAWSLSYDFPVHQIGPSFQPKEKGDPTYLVVYRNWEDRVRFMELNAATARLLALFKDNKGEETTTLLGRLADELGMDHTAMLDFGVQQIKQLMLEAVFVPEGVD